MDEVLELWPAEARTVQALPHAPSARNLLLWKAGLLLVTTLALVPILAWKNTLGATVYVAFLATVHVAGLGVFLWGVRRHDVAPDLRGLLVRLAGLVVLFSLAALARHGLQASLGSAVFWTSLTAIWLLHTAGAAILHLRPRRAHATQARSSLCPFL